MLKKLEQALKESFKKNKPHFADENWSADDYYGIAITGMADDGSINLTWTFKSDQKYCCDQAGCHTSLSYAGASPRARADILKKWAAIHEFLPKSTPKISLNVTHVTEAGCILEYGGAIPTEFVAKTRSYTYLWKEPEDTEACQESKP